MLACARVGVIRSFASADDVTLSICRGSTAVAVR